MSLFMMARLIKQFTVTFAAINGHAGKFSQLLCDRVQQHLLLKLLVLLATVALLLLYNGYIVQQPEAHAGQHLQPVLPGQGQLSEFQANDGGRRAGADETPAGIQEPRTYPVPYLLPPTSASEAGQKQLSRDVTQSMHEADVNSTKQLSEDVTREVEVSLTKPTTRFIVYSCNKISVCGGWADRQKGMVVTFLISAMMNRKFRIDMPIPCDLQFFLTPNEVDWLMRPGETEGHSISKIEGVDGHGLTFVKKLLKDENMLIKEMDADYVFITTNMETVKQLMQHPLAKNVAWLSNETSVAKIYRNTLLKLFTLSSGLRKTLQVAMETRPADKKLVCGQVRVGGQRGDFKDSETFNSIESVKVLLDFFSKYNDSRSYRMYFASDSKEVVDLGAATFPDLVIHIPGPITHVDKSKGSDACTGFAHAILEQTVLSTCDVLVISESGFGKIAAFLRNTDNELYLFHHGKIERFQRDMKFMTRSW